MSDDLIFKFSQAVCDREIEVLTAMQAELEAELAKITKGINDLRPDFKGKAATGFLSHWDEKVAGYSQWEITYVRKLKQDLIAINNLVIANDVAMATFFTYRRITALRGKNK